MTREELLHFVRDIGVARLNDEQDRTRLRGVMHTTRWTYLV